MGSLPLSRTLHQPVLLITMLGRNDGRSLASLKGRRRERTLSILRDATMTTRERDISCSSVTHAHACTNIHMQVHIAHDTRYAFERLLQARDSRHAASFEIERNTEHPARTRRRGTRGRETVKRRVRGSSWVRGEWLRHFTMRQVSVLRKPYSRSPPTRRLCEPMNRPLSLCLSLSLSLSLRALLKTLLSAYPIILDPMFLAGNCVRSLCILVKRRDVRIKPAIGLSASSER